MGCVGYMPAANLWNQSSSGNNNSESLALTSSQKIIPFDYFPHVIQIVNEVT